MTSSRSPQRPERPEIGPLISDDKQRRRLIHGLASALAAKGRAELTVSDVVKSAAVSRRTFYEHFRNLQEAVLASHRATAAAVLELVNRRCAREGSWEARVRAGLATVIEFAVAESHLATLLVIDSFTFDRALAEEVLETRREFAALLRPQGGGPDRPGPPAFAATFLVGAVAGAIAPLVRDGERRRLRELEAPLLELILVPYLGRAEAARAARTAGARP